MKALLSALILAGLLALIGLAKACPMCKEAVPASGDGTSTLTSEEQHSIQQARAWNNSIYLFVGMPYLLVGSVGFLVYRSIKKARQLPPSAPPTEPA